jgi:hypothetical protein
MIKMTKKVLVTLCFWLAALAGFAQEHMPYRANTYTDEAPPSGFQKQNLFVGGGLILDFGADQFNVGVNPEIGYSLNRWLDAGIVVNFLYNSISPDAQYYYNPDLSSKQFTYGGGVFARAYVLHFLFLTAQPEYNWITETSSQGGSPKVTYNTSAPSLLLGVGYGRRIIGQTTFYIELMFDAINNVNSPYNDGFGHPLPILRVGFDIFLHRRNY